jgi:hypothetical protein
MSGDDEGPDPRSRRWCGVSLRWRSRWGEIVDDGSLAGHIPTGDSDDFLFYSYIIAIVYILNSFCYSTIKDHLITYFQVLLTTFFLRVYVRSMSIPDVHKTFSTAIFMSSLSPSSNKMDTAISEPSERWLVLSIVSHSMQILPSKPCGCVGTRVSSPSNSADK